MINKTLYLREMKKSLKMLLIFAMILTMYVAIIISMYDPKLMATLDKFVEVMPQIMAAVGMSAGATSLMGFMISYLYGFIRSRTIATYPPWHRPSSRSALAPQPHL